MDKNSQPSMRQPMVPPRAEVDQYHTLLDMHDRTLEERASEDEQDPELRRKLAAWRTELVERGSIDPQLFQEP